MTLNITVSYAGPADLVPIAARHGIELVPVRADETEPHTSSVLRVVEQVQGVVGATPETRVS